MSWLPGGLRLLDVADPGWRGGGWVASSQLAEVAGAATEEAGHGTGGGTGPGQEEAAQRTRDGELGEKYLVIAERREERETLTPGQT